MDNQHYYTQSETAEILSVSESSVKNYIKLISDEEKNGTFNSKNQPNDAGIKILKKIAYNQNPHIKKYEDYEKEIEDLKKQINLLKKEKQDLNQKFIDYTTKTTENFSKLQEQSNIIIASLTKANQELKEIKMLESQKDTSDEKPKGFFARFFGQK